MALETIDLTPRIGTQIMATKEQLLNGEHAEEIRRLLVQRGVVLIRGIDITDDEEIAFSGTLGKIRIDYDDNPTDEQFRHYYTFPVKSLPLVWQHRSGRKSLIVSLSAEYVEGLEREDSDAFMPWLRAWVEQPQYCYSHEWRMGDLLIWDNTGTMHRARPFDKASGRRLHRVTLEGVESVQPVTTERVAA